MSQHTRSAVALLLAATVGVACSAPAEQQHPLGGDTFGGAAGSSLALGASASVAGGGSGGAGGTTGAAESGGTGGVAGREQVGGSPALPRSSDDYPALLSATGLYVDITTGTLAPGVRAYAPQFTLWSDGSSKTRWLYLPPGEQIDTSDMDDWVYPVGTKFWKEFASDRLPDGTHAAQPLRIETRLLWKFGKAQFDWLSVAYVWNDSQTDATAVPDGVTDARGTLHDVPSRKACDTCHTNKRQRQIGPGAVALSHSGPGLTLSTLVAENLLTVPPAFAIVVPGTPQQQSALGYLHANCGHCHREGSVAGERYDLRTWLSVESLTSVETTDTYQHYVNRLTAVPESELEYRIKGGSPDDSELIRRMLLRGAPAQMPPTGTELIDEAALAALRAWILTLPPP